MVASNIRTEATAVAAGRGGQGVQLPPGAGGRGAPRQETEQILGVIMLQCYN